jgi:hypothetical protein
MNGGGLPQLCSPLILIQSALGCHVCLSLPGLPACPRYVGAHTPPLTRAIFGLVIPSCRVSYTPRSLMKELERLIGDGQITARIDSQNKVLYAR